MKTHTASNGMQIVELPDIRYARAVRDYAAGTLDVADFYKTLHDLGFDEAEIRLHVDQPGYRAREGVAP